jgi:hypothetical protein
MVGGALWFALVAADPSTNRWGSWLLGMSGAALVMGVLMTLLRVPTLRGAAGVGMGLVLVPSATALWTTPRGDGDGLWVLIVPELGVMLVATMALAALAARVTAVVATGPRLRLRWLLRATVVVAAVLISVWGTVLTRQRWPEPWTPVRLVANAVVWPADLGPVVRTEHGDRSCRSGCSPSVLDELRPGADPFRTCAVLADQIVVAFPDADDASTAHYCRWIVDLPGHGSRVEVTGEPADTSTGRAVGAVSFTAIPPPSAYDPH